MRAFSTLETQEAQDIPSIERRAFVAVTLRSPIPLYAKSNEFGVLNLLKIHSNQLPNKSNAEQESIANMALSFRNRHPADAKHLENAANEGNDAATKSFLNRSTEAL